ncbi:MAG: hypothetical protein HYZ34_13850 [Ignavibacteriae bacterium]|nr:hypothetical protein [Ignavibacteriota bacterium]
MSQQELVKKVIQVLEENHIEYMITGSVASSLQGEPRMTHDLDVLFTITFSQIPILLDNFQAPLFYIDEESIRDAIKRRSMFNVIDLHGGEKVDFWFLKFEPFDESRIQRRVRETLFGVDVSVSSPEDTILAKLKWAQESGGSEKQFTDALRVFEVQQGKLNLHYLEMWAKELDVEELFLRLKGAVENT